MSPDRKHARAYAIAVSALAAGALLLSPRPAWSQPPPTMAAVNQATRMVDRNVRAEEEKRLMGAPRKAGGPVEEAEKIVYSGPKLFIRSITLTGTESFPAEDFRQILATYEGRDVYETELKEGLTNAITREYLRRGIIATCFVPAQEIVDGAVTIQVVEAKMGDLHTAPAHYYPEDRLRYYWTIKPGEVLRYDRMNRAMQFMNKNPDREAKSTLKAGTRPGTTDVYLTQKTWFPFHVTASMDNEGAVPTGRVRTGIGFVENNLLGLDDTVVGGYNGGKNFCGGYGYHKVPVSPFGTTLLYGYSRTYSYPKKDFEPFGISSMAESYSAYFYQDIYRKDVYAGDFSAGIEANNKRVVADNGTLNADRLRIVRLGPSFLARTEKNAVYVKPQYSQGLNMLGARRKSEFSSRQAENTFSKATLSAQFQQLLVHSLQAQVRFNGQFASEKLTPQEELYMGGIDSVRGYPSGDYLADSGFSGNIELLVPATFLPDWLVVPYGERPLGQELTGIFFFDYGYGMKRGMIEGEQEERRMASLGAGVRVRILNQANLRLEWGFPLDPANYGSTEFSRSRLHFSVDAQDNLDREVTRLVAEIRRKRVDGEAWKVVNAEARRADSPLRRRAYGYFALAERADAAGDPVTARIFYVRAAAAARAAQQSAARYIDALRDEIAALREEDGIAEMYEKRGNLVKAKEISKKIGEDAILKPMKVPAL